MKPYLYSQTTIGYWATMATYSGHSTTINDWETIITCDNSTMALSSWQWALMEFNNALIWLNGLETSWQNNNRIWPLSRPVSGRGNCDVSQCAGSRERSSPKISQPCEMLALLPDTVSRSLAWDAFVVAGEKKPKEKKINKSIIHMPCLNLDFIRRYSHHMLFHYKLQYCE